MTPARVILLFLVLPFSAPAAEKPLTADQVRFFESRIRPLFAERCFSCHGSERQRAGLRLDSAEALAKGGSSGDPVLVSGQPDRSLLVRAVRHAEGIQPMPPKEKLNDRQIADLTRWIQMGAPYPKSGAPVVATQTHWAFRPLANVTAPVVRDSAWIRTPVDRFVLARLEANGIVPAPPADRLTLIRRLTFDLTGLPPTPEEVQAFVQDSRPDAYEKLVDRLLASPAYGERWGRHWLDVARYADSNGLDENVAHGNAWRYRDHVVAAFNRHQPYDQFILEQVAGDLLPASEIDTRRRQLIATGFLALGPKVLAEVDERKMELDIVDEQVETLGRAVLGLTLGCARCHDHKFDPISLEDYYGLAGIFLSTKTMESFRKVARWHENPLATGDEQRREAEHAQKITRMKENLARAGKKPEETKRLREELTRLENASPVVPSAMGVSEAKPTEAPLLRRGNHLNPGKPVPRRFPVVLAGETQSPLPAKSSGRLELARWLVRSDNSLTARVMVNRVWRWHFGQGLVRSVDNFGLLGEKPTHPELLDYLANRFVRSDWSLPVLHRLLVCSATYRQASRRDPKTATLDPENRLLARFEMRRLEAEEIRDSLLAVSHGLDRTMGGSLLHVANRAYLFDHTSRDQTAYDRPRRSLYLPVIRNNLYDVFSLFDSTDATVPSGDRATTTVATQALFWMNSDLAHQSAGRLARILLARPDLNDAGRIALLYRTAYGREATAREVDRALASLGDFETEPAKPTKDRSARREKAWTFLCQAVLAANEFLYVN